MSSFDVSGLDIFEKDMIQTITKKYPKEAKKFISKQATDVKNQAKKDTPEDTGESKKRWKTSSKANKQVVEANVRNDGPLTHLLEDGHFIYNQHGGDYGFYPGAHMLEKAVMKKDAEFSNKLDEFIDKVLDEVRL